jgi:hypothetical protein
MQHSHAPPNALAAADALFAPTGATTTTQPLGAEVTPVAAAESINPDAFTEASEHFTASDHFVPEELAAAALVHPLAVGDRVRCTPETWRLGVIEQPTQQLWAFVPETAIEATPPDDVRYKCVLELIETEETYGASMGLVCETIIQPLTRAGILPAPTIARVFTSSENLWSASKELSEALRARLRDGWDSEQTRVGDALSSVLNAQEGMLGGHGKFADAFIQYINGFDQAQRTLKSLDDKPEW